MSESPSRRHFMVNSASADLNYSDTQRRGYLLMTVTHAAVKGEFVFMSNVKNKTYSASVGKTITVPVSGSTVYA